MLQSIVQDHVLAVQNIFMKGVSFTKYQLIAQFSNHDLVLALQ